MNTLHGESWKYSTRTVQSRGIKLCFTYNHLHTVSIYHVEAIRKWSYVNSNYCSHRQWKSADYFLSFIATQKEKPLLLPNLSSFGWVCRRYFKLQYIEIMVEKKCRMSAPKSLWASRFSNGSFSRLTGGISDATVKITAPATHWEHPAGARRAGIGGAWACPHHTMVWGEAWQGNIGDFWSI